MLLPFLELHEDDIDSECYKCESIVSSDDVSESYRLGLDKIENYIQSKEYKDMVQTVLTEKDKYDVKTDSADKFASMCDKLNSEAAMDANNVSEFDESTMSEISVEDELDCSAFTKELTDEPKRPLIS